MTPPQPSPIAGTDAPVRPPGSHLRASGSSGSARRAQEGRSGSGTGILASVHMTSLRCLLGEAFRGEGLGIPSPLLGCQHRQAPCLWQSAWLGSRCLPFGCRHADDDLHLGRCGPEGSYAVRCSLSMVVVRLLFTGVLLVATMEDGSFFRRPACLEDTGWA